EVAADATGAQDKNIHAAIMRHGAAGFVTALLRVFARTLLFATRRALSARSGRNTPAHSHARLQGSNEIRSIQLVLLVLFSLR
ncbi:MAG: hypothetical protein ACK5UX_05415, partial [Burkholderiales bacterium]